MPCKICGKDNHGLFADEFFHDPVNQAEWKAFDSVLNYITEYYKKYGNTKGVKMVVSRFVKASIGKVKKARK